MQKYENFTFYGQQKEKIILPKTNLCPVYNFLK